MSGSDVVFGFKAEMFFVSGTTRGPKPYYIKTHKNFRALLVAGGNALYAQTEPIIQVRHMNESGRKVMELKMENFEMQYIPIKDRDLLLILFSDVGKFFHSLWPNIGFLSVEGFCYSNPQR